MRKRSLVLVVIVIAFVMLYIKSPFKSTKPKSEYDDIFADNNTDERVINERIADNPTSDRVNSVYNPPPAGNRNPVGRQVPVGTQATPVFNRKFPGNYIINRTQLFNDESFTINGKLAKIKDQAKVMGKSCLKCKKLMNAYLFPASITLEKLGGFAKYPYESDIVSTLDLHVRQCVCERVYLHQICSSHNSSLDRNDGYFNKYDRIKCAFCDKPALNPDIALTALKCLYNSTKPYEFAYIYKTLNKYQQDICSILDHSDAPLDKTDKIKENIGKCNFKGKKSMLAGLGFYQILCGRSPSINALNNFLQYSLDENGDTTFTFWEYCKEKYKRSEEVREFISEAFFLVKKEHAEKHAYLCTRVLYFYFKYLDNAEIVTLISKLLHSEQYFLLSTFQVAQFAIRYPIFRSAEKLPNSIAILSMVEKNIKDAKDSMLLSGSINKKAEAVAKCISAKPWNVFENENAPIFIYLKRLYKLKSQSSKEAVLIDKKKEILFYESLIVHLLKNMIKSSIELPPYSIDDCFVTSLKVCIFYNKKYNFKMSQSPFIALLLQEITSSCIENFLKVSNTKEENQEILVLKALNIGSFLFVPRETEIELSKNGTQVFLAEELIKRGRFLMKEGMLYIERIRTFLC
ncbi:hypothetical protein ENBRE01_2987, partial [Enteropsectra breve]